MADSEMVVVAELEKILPPDMNPAIGKFLLARQGYMSVTSFPTPGDRLNVSTVIFAKALGRPPKTASLNTDFNFEVLDKLIIIPLKNEHHIPDKPRLNYGYWILAQYPENFPFLTRENTMFVLPIEKFDHLLQTLDTMGWEFY